MGDDNAVSTIMTTNVVTLSPDQSVPEAADVLSEHRIGAAPVVDGSGKLVGLLRDEDLLVTESNLHVPTAIAFLGAELIWPPSMHRYEAELKRAAASKVSEIMSTEFDTVVATDTVESVATLMHDKGLSHVPVVDANGSLLGIVARGDLIRFLAATS
jgi:CBS-domain-containing membrane protein